MKKKNYLNYRLNNIDYIQLCKENAELRERIRILKEANDARNVHK